MLRCILSLLVIFTIISFAKCDTPANCTYEDIKGLWIFQEGPRGNDKTINCNSDNCILN